MLKQIAVEMLRHGARSVYIMARNLEKAQAVADELTSGSPSGKCYAIKGDVRDPKSCAGAVEEVVKAEGKVDILVNGAAGNFLAQADQISHNGFKTVLEIDTIGTFNMSKEVFNQSMKERGGVILNITASLHYNGTAMQVHSAAAKAAIDSMTKTMAVEWGPYDVRVVGLCPGFITATEGAARLSDISTVNSKSKANSAIDQGAEKQKMVEEHQKRYIPLHRLGTGQDIANGALYLTSDVASYVTGCVLMVDAGQWLTAANFATLMPGFLDMWKAPKMAKL